MGGAQITTPDGRRWTVRRRWAPRRARWRGPVGKKILEFLDAPFNAMGDLEGILIVIGLVAFVVFMIFLGVPVLLFLLDLLLIVILVLAGVMARVLFRRPWTVEARSVAPLPLERRWSVVGWRRSGALLEDVKTRLLAGQQLEQLPADAP